MLTRLGHHLRSFEISTLFSDLIPPLFNKYCRRITEISITLDNESARSDDIIRYEAFTCLSKLEKVTISISSGKLVNWFEFSKCFPEKIKTLVIYNSNFKGKIQFNYFAYVSYWFIYPITKNNTTIITKILICSISFCRHLVDFVILITLHLVILLSTLKLWWKYHVENHWWL